MHQFKTVNEFLDSLDKDKRVQVDALRSIIMSVEPILAEHIKWNAPSYVLDGEDRLTFNLFSQTKLILHMGATRKEDKKGAPVLTDTTGLIEWNSDIRGMLFFKDLEDIDSKRHSVEQIIKGWLAIKP